MSIDEGFKNKLNELHNLLKTMKNYNSDLIEEKMTEFYGLIINELPFLGSELFIEPTRNILRYKTSMLILAVAENSNPPTLEQKQKIDDILFEIRTIMNMAKEISKDSEIKYDVKRLLDEVNDEIKNILF